MPTYSIAEAARYLRLPISTVRAWTLGNRYPTRGGMRTAPALVRPAQAARPVALSFHNVVELFVLASLRRAHQISMPRVRRALAYVQKHMGRPRPLIEAQFLTDGVDLFINEYSRLINASREGQIALRDILWNSLQRIDRDQQGLVIGFFPYLRDPSETRYVEINPRRAFGRMVVAGTGIPTEIIAERFLAGDSYTTLAEDYGLNTDVIQWAIRFELWDAKKAA